MTENFDNKNDEELQNINQGSHKNKVIRYIGIMITVLVVNLFIGIMFFDDIGIIILNTTITVIDIVISALTIRYISNDNIKNARILTFVSLFIGILLCVIDLIYAEAFISMLSGEFVANDIVIMIPIINAFIITVINKIDRNKESVTKSDWFYNK